MSIGSHVNRETGDRMANQHQKRRHLFVDPKVQGALILRVVMYWVVFVATITLMLLCWRIVTGPARPFYMHFGEMWLQFGPAVVAAFLLLPLVIYDIVQMSNRFCGPLFRLRRSLRALARGEHVAPISFREGDFWPEFALEFNTLLARVQREVPPTGPQSTVEAEPQPAETPVAATAE
jgi:hypothetical protein